MTLPHIVLLILDSVRAANTTWHGYARPTTPFLEALAAQSLTYVHAYSPSTEGFAGDCVHAVQRHFVDCMLGVQVNFPLIFRPHSRRAFCAVMRAGPSTTNNRS